MPYKACWDWKQASLSLVTRISLLGFGLMGTKKALAASISWTSGILTITSTNLLKEKGQAFIDRGEGD